MSEPDQTEPSRTRVTVLGGFLGSGKTTLLNAMLRAADEPLGVIVNDFGSINVDAELLGGQANVKGEVALQNGCICCTIRSDLLAAMLSLISRPDPPRHIIIETSGVSDPAAVARTFLHPQLADLVELATIAVCVDAVQFNDLNHQEWDLARDQVRAADFIVLTKCDEATDVERSVVHKVLETIAGDLRVIESSLDDAPIDLILDAPAAWGRPRKLSIVREQPHVHEVGEHLDHEHHHHHDHAHHDGKDSQHGSEHAHDDGEHDHHHHHDGHAYETWTFRTEKPLSIYGLRRALRSLPSEVFRAKGFVYVAQDRTSRIIVQVAGRRAELVSAGPWPDGAAVTEIVFLGPMGALDPDALGALFESCEDDGADSTEGFMDEMLGFFNRLLTGLPPHVG